MATYKPKKHSRILKSYLKARRTKHPIDMKIDINKEVEKLKREIEGYGIDEEIVEEMINEIIDAIEDR